MFLKNFNKKIFIINLFLLLCLQNWQHTSLYNNNNLYIQNHCCIYFILTGIKYSILLNVQAVYYLYISLIG